MGDVPEATFEWVRLGQGSEWSAERLSDSADCGAFLEVDLAYPVELHDGHNDFPMPREDEHPTQLAKPLRRGFGR